MNPALAMYERGMRASVDHERAVLGTMIAGTEIELEAGNAFLQDSDFSLHAHQILHRKVREMFTAGRFVDRVSVAKELLDAGKLESVGGMAAVSELELLPPRTGAFESYMRKLREDAIGRQALRLISALSDVAFHGTPEDIAATVQRGLDAIVGNSSEAKEMASLADVYGKFSNFEELTGKATKPEISIPFICPLGGLRIGEYTILAARPGDGKSALAMQLAVWAAKHGHSVFFFSFEMRDKSLLRRILAGEAQVSHYRLANGKLREDEAARAWEAMKTVCDLPVYIHDEHSGTGVEQIRHTLRKAQAKGRCPAFVVIDYLQLMHGAGGHNRNEEISRISRGLKALTLDFPIALLALSQLSRDQEKQGKREPILSDLRDSGSLEQDADNVVFIHPVGDVDVPERHVRFIIRKQRAGVTGAVELFFVRDQLRFASMHAGDGHAP